MSRLQRQAALKNHNGEATLSLPACAGKNRKFSIAAQRAQRLSLAGTIIFISLVVSACGPAPHTLPSMPPLSEWHEFQGTWTTTGSRSIMPLEGNRRASIANYNGSLVLAGPSRPNVGFRAEAIVFNDSSTGMIGRAVWTDEHGDQAFSELQGAGTRTDNRIVGTFVGGTGRYAGATGTYEFSWRFVLESDDGNLQGESVGLKGRVRVDSSHATSTSGDPHS